MSRIGTRAQKRDSATRNALKGSGARKDPRTTITAPKPEIRAFLVPLRSFLALFHGGMLSKAMSETQSRGFGNPDPKLLEHGEGNLTPLAQIRRMQRVLYKRTQADDVDDKCLPQLASAWEKLEGRKGILCMRPAPKPVDVDRVPRSKRTPRPHAELAPEPPASGAPEPGKPPGA